MKVLYIHGYGSDRNSRTGKELKRLLGEVVTYTFNLLNIEQTQSDINYLIKSQGIDTLIGSSLGGFHVLINKNMEIQRRIVINPCLHPSRELPKIVQIDDSTKRTFSVYEKTQLIRPDAEKRLEYFGIFGKHDELFSYVDEFKKLFGINNPTPNQIFMKGHHHLSTDELEVGLNKALGFFGILQKSVQESYINEHFVNIFPNKDLQDIEIYKDEVWNILQQSYKPIGGLLGVDSIDDLIADSDMWKLVTKGGKVVAVSCYTFKRGGRKTMLCGTDGTEEGKRWFYKIIDEDIQRLDREQFAEVSGVMEYIFKKRGANPIPGIVAQRILSDKQLEILDDGFHYRRMIGGQLCTKIMYGNYKK